MYLVLEARKRYANLADHDQNRTSQKSKKNSWSIFQGSNYVFHMGVIRKKYEIKGITKDTGKGAVL